MGFAVLTVAVRYTFWSPDISPILKTIFFILLGGDAVCYFVAAWGVRRGVKWTYLFTIGLIVINILAAIFDDVGLTDLVAAGINILMLVMLFYGNRKMYGSSKG